SEDSAELSDRQRTRRKASLAMRMSAPLIRSSPPVPDGVNLREFRSWYTGKYHREDDEVSEDEWDRMEGAKLSITTIKGMRGADWEELSISFGTGKNLSRRAEVSEAKVKSREWYIYGLGL